MNRSTTEKKRRTLVPAKAERTFETHAALMNDMREFQQEVSRTPEAALAFLKRAGLVTASGKPRQLIRG